jgi:hypothetical protein
MQNDLSESVFPITPPPALVHQWADMLASRSDQAVFTKAAQWGADQELKRWSCCFWQQRAKALAPRLQSFAANRYPTHTNITIVTKDNAKRSA